MLRLWNRALVGVQRQWKSSFRYCTSSISDMERNRCAKEVRFPVPWGHIAGLEWGDPQGRHVLAVHGWLDNAGSFDKLIPHLSPSLHVVAVDLPGHGQSSHRPPGTFYHAHNYIADIKYVIDSLKWDKFSFMAHSMGTGISLWFSAALPEMVDCLVLIEGVGYVSTPLEDLPGRMGKVLRGLGSLSTEDTKVYSTWDAVVDRMLEGHQVMDPSFTREAAATLSARGSKKLPDGTYQFTRDLMVKALSLLRIPQSVSSTFVSAVQCPVLLIVGENSLVAKHAFNSLISDQLPKQLKAVRVPGGHHVHLCQPGVLHKAVDTFLQHHTVHPEFVEISKL